MASMNISMNADSADEVGRLLDIVKGAAGADHAHTVGPDDMPEMPPMPLKGANDMRTDMENFSSIVNRAEEEVGEEEILGDKAIQQIEEGIGSLDAMRKQAAQRVSPQSVPQEVREVIEETTIEPSILEKVEEVKSNSLLAREE